MYYFLAFTSRITRFILCLCSSFKKEVIMNKLIHDDILYIYKLISLNYSNMEIADDIGVNASTIYRLIKSNIQIAPVKKSFRNYPMKNCIHRQICRKSISSCPEGCTCYIKWICPKLKKFPYICNFCPDKKHCVKEKMLEHLYLLLKTIS